MYFLPWLVLKLVNYEWETKDNIVLRPLLLSSSNKNQTIALFYKFSKTEKKNKVNDMWVKNYTGYDSLFL